MPSLGLRIALVLAAGVGGLLAAAPSHADAPQTRILIVGDSITQGRPGDHTWRYFAWKALEQAGTAVDFVGPRRGVHAGSSWDYRGPDAYADPAFDQDHGAWWGQALTGASREPLAELVPAYAPDVIVSNFGINDLSTRTPEELAAAYRSWILEARSLDAGVDLVIGKVPHSWVHDGRPVAFNAMVTDLAAELDTVESRVEVFEVRDFTAADTWDGTHLLASGERKYARAVTAALGRLGLSAADVPEPEPTASTPATGVPSAAQPRPAAATAVAPAVVVSPAAVPSRPRSVRAVRHGARVVVSWRGAAERFEVKCGQKVADVSRSRVVVRSAAPTCRVRSVGSTGVSAWAGARVRG